MRIQLKMFVSLLILNTDLSPLFNWNTKQVFIYLAAEYEGKEIKQKSIDERTENQVVFWPGRRISRSHFDMV